ncbi:MAG: hypothetical protein Unbinned5406contig1000_2 [Prokaryotic dsDNA virus sp.]|nr:MAG: hypothetical protein Unbinned5406contig1000_2 [Prokaryotic dsDNA virus sp.]|tara:strand:+ start:20714 stop:29101 length:8388 start_codon:yes stop_codon:yes gene_type:complete
MGLEDLNPYGKAGLQSFQSRTMDSMDASPDIARVTDNYSIYGMDQMSAPNMADVAAFGESLYAEPDIQQPSVGFNKATNQVFVNGLMFDADDYQTADRSASEEILTRTPTGLPDGFSQMTPQMYGKYIEGVRDPGKLRLMGKNFGIGVDNLQMLGGAGAAYLGDAIGSETLSGYGRDVIEQQQEDLRRKEPFQRTFTDDVVAEGEVADWFLGNLAQQGPNLIESIAAFFVGGLVATGSTGNPVTGAMGGIAAAFGKTAFKKKLMDAVAKKRAGEALSKAEKKLIAGTGAVIAGSLNNLRTGVSDVYLEMLENADGEVPGTSQRLAALAAGVPYAAAETFSEFFVASKFFNPSATANVFKRVGKAAGTGAVAEGVTEGIQESLVIGTDAATSDREAFTIDNGIRLINSIAAGAAVGGPISGVSGLRKGQEADLLNPEEPQQPQQGTALAPIGPEAGPTRPMNDPQGPIITPVNQLEFQEPTLEDNRPFAVATIEDPDFTVNPEGVVDPNPQVFDPMDQPVSIEGAFIPGTEQQPQGALNVTPPVTTLNEVNQNFGVPTNRIEEVPAPPPILSDPNQLDLPLEVEPETVTTPPPREVQLPLFTPQEAPKQKPPAKPLTDNIPQPETEFAPSTAPQLENRRNKKDIAATVKSKQQISGGKQEDNIVDPDKRQKKFDTINYTQGVRLNLLPQFVLDRYAEAIKKIKVARNFTNFTGAHHNGGIVLAGKYTSAQPVFPNIVAHELGHASHSLLAGEINDNPAVLAELQAIENLLYPDLRATVLQAIADGKKLDNEFFNYLLSPEELIAEFNVLRLANPEQASQVAPNLSALLESVEQAPDLVVDRKTFPIGIGRIVTKATEYFDGDFTTINAPIKRAQDRAVKAQTKADKLKKGAKKEEPDAVQEPEPTQVDAQEQTQDGERVGEEVQETPRVRTKNKSLKKEKVEEQSVQAEPQSKPKVATLKRGKAKVAPAVVAQPEPATETPKPVVKKPAASKTPAEMWDDNKPYPDSPSLADITDQKAVKIFSAMTAEEMASVWTDQAILESLPEGTQAQILQDNYINATAAEMPGVLGTLIDIAFAQGAASPAVQKRVGSFLLNVPLGPASAVREIAIDNIVTLGATDQLTFTGQPTWYKYAKRLDIMPDIQKGLEKEGIPGLSRVVQADKAIADKSAGDIILNEQELSRAGATTKATYSDKQTGAKAQAQRLSIQLESLPSKLQSKDDKSVLRVERSAKGAFGVKPDMTFLFNGVPLADYFDTNGKLKLQQRGETFVLNPKTLKEARTQERKAKTDLKDEAKLTKAQKEIDAAKAKKAAQQMDDAKESGYVVDNRSVLEQLEDPEGNYLRYDNDKPSTPMNPLKLKATLNKILSKFAIKPNVTIAKNSADLQNVNPELYAKIIKDRPDFASINASGYSIGPDVVLFSDFIQNDTHLKFTLAHEAMGHFGLRSIVPKSQLKSVLENIYNTSSHIRAVTDRYMAVHGIGKLEAIEEALADHVAYVDTNVLNRIWQPIKKFLQKIGIPFDHDGAAYYVNQLRRYVRNGEIPGYVSPDQLAANIEELNNSEVGRFSATFVDMTSGAFQIPTPGLSQGLNKFLSKRKNVGDLLGRAAEQLQTLDNIAQRSLGVMKMFDVFRRQAATARAILSELDEITASATKADYWGLGTGLSKAEKKIVSDLLAYSNAYFAQRVTEADVRNAPDIIIKDAVSGKPMINDAALDFYIDNATLSMEEIAGGIDYLEGGVNEKTYNVEGGFDPNNERHKAIYKAYVDLRKGVNKASAKVALGKYIAASKMFDGNIAAMSKISSQVTDQDLDVFKELSEAFQKIYQMGPKENNGRYRVNAKTLQQGEDFINGVTRALWQSEASADLRNMKADDNVNGSSQKAINAILAYNRTDAGKQNPIDLTSILDGLDRMRAYKDQSGGNVFTDKVVMKKIQQPLKDQVFTDTQLINANVMAKQTAYDAYVPFSRSGNSQLRFQAYVAVVDSDGKVTRGQPIKINSSFSAAFPYYQMDNRAKLSAMASSYNTDLGQTVFEIPNERGGVDKVVMVAQVGDSTAGTPSNQTMNYDEFASVLTTLGIDLGLAERERIVEALSKQHDKVRNHLKKKFQAGFDPDIIKSVAEHLESQAAIAAKNEHRSDIDMIMADEENWNGSRDTMVAAYKEYDAARKTGNKEAARIKQEKFEMLAHMFVESGEINAKPFTFTNSKGEQQTITPTGGKGERNRNTSAQVLEFYAQSNDITISAEDALSKGPLSVMKAIAVAMQLGGSIAAGLINLTSIPLMAMPYMATYNHKTGTGGGFGFGASTVELTKAGINLKNIKWADPAWIKANVLADGKYKSFGLTLDEAQFLERQTSRGILDAALVNSLAGSARGNFFNSANWTGITRKYMVPFAYTEQMNRRITALAAYRLDKRRRMAANPSLTDSDFQFDSQQSEDMVSQIDQPDLFGAEEKAVEVVNKSQGDYAMYNRPKIARGNWMQYIYMYKQFTVIATQLVRMLPPSGRAYYLGALMAVAGLKGLPFGEDLLDLIDTLAQMFNLKVPPAELALGQFVSDVTGSDLAAQVMNRGLLDQFMGGATVSSRLSLGDLLPMTGVFLDGASIPQELKNFAGPIYSAMAGGVVMATDLARAPFKADTGGELLRIGQTSPIAGLRNITDTAVYLQSGSVVNSRGYTVVRDVGVGTLVSRLLGFYPAEATRSNDAVRITKRLVDNQKAIVASYREQYVRASLLKDRRSMRDIERAVREHNKVHRKGRSAFYIDDFKGKVKRAVKSAQEGAGDRFLKTTPKTTRDTVTDIVSNLYGVNIR